VTIKTTAGPVTLARPKLRGTTERFASQLFGKGVTKTNALEALVIAGFVRGLSTRDVEAALSEALGEAATVSSWTTCFWTAATSNTTPPPRPSRCWPPGVSTPTANRCLSGWRAPQASPVMPGRLFGLYATKLGRRVRIRDV